MFVTLVPAMQDLAEVQKMYKYVSSDLGPMLRLKNGFDEKNEEKIVDFDTNYSYFDRSIILTWVLKKKTFFEKI
jgi:hypothetical protein